MQKSTEPCLIKVQKSPKPCLGGTVLHDTDCNYVDDHAADVEDVGYPIRTGSFGDRETLVGRCHVLLLPTKRVCGSVGDLDRNVVRRDKRDCIFLKGDK